MATADAAPQLNWATTRLWFGVIGLSLKYLYNTMQLWRSDAFSEAEIAQVPKDLGDMREWRVI